MDKLLIEASNRGLRSVHLDSSTVSKGFYDRLGFRTVREDIIDLGDGERLDYFYMEREIGRDHLRS